MITITKKLRRDIVESEIPEEIKKVAEEFKKDNDIIEVTDRYFRYKPKKEFVTSSSGEDKDGKFSFIQG